MKSLLIVDACAQTRLVLTPLLQEQGYDLTFVADAKSALDALWEKSYGLVLVDTTDISCGGEALLNTLAAADSSSSQKCAAFSEIEDEEKKARLLKAGCAAVLSKPIHFHDLTMVLAELTSAA